MALFFLTSPSLPYFSLILKFPKPTSFAASLNASHTDYLLSYAASRTKLPPYIPPSSARFFLELFFICIYLLVLSLSLILNCQILLSLSSLDMAIEVVEADAGEEAHRREEVSGALVPEKAPLVEKKPWVEKLLCPWICCKGNKKGRESLGLLDGSEEGKAILGYKIDIGNGGLEIGRGLGDRELQSRV